MDTCNETRKTLAQFITDNGITMTAIPIAHRPDGLAWEHAAFHWHIRLQRGRHWTTFYYSGGAAVTTAEIGSVLNSAIIDSQSYEDSSDDFYAFAREFGYELDDEQKSAHAHKVFNACKRMSERLKRFLGDALYNEALYEVEPL